MDKTAFYRALGAAENRAVARVAAARRAESDLSPYLGRQMAFDDAEEAYRAALVELGVPEEDVADLPLAALKICFKHVAGGGQLSSRLGLVRAGRNPEGSVRAFEGATAPQLTAGLALTGYTGNEATAATTRSRGMAGDSAATTPLSAILKSIGAKAPVNMSPRRRAAAW